MKSISLILCFLALLLYGCGNNEKTSQTDDEKSYSEELGQDMGDSINKMKQKAQDAVDASHNRQDEAKDAGLE